MVALKELEGKNPSQGTNLSLYYIGVIALISDIFATIRNILSILYHKLGGFGNSRRGVPRFRSTIFNYYYMKLFF